MREIKPYKTLDGAKAALDNGGRFFNLFVRLGDDVVDISELKRAAGVYTGDMKTFLYFDMALLSLPAGQRAAVLDLLSTDLRERYLTNQPRVLTPSTVEEHGKAGSPTIVSGYPVFVEDKTQFTGFIVLVVPVIILIPIYDQFDVYEVYDTPDMKTPRTVIAITRGLKRLDGVHTRYGGVLKEVYFEDKTDKDHGLYLEALFYASLAKDES